MVETIVIPESLDELTGKDKSDKQIILDLLGKTIGSFGEIGKGLLTVVSGFASNAVTGIPLLAASSEYLYKHKGFLPKDIAALLLSPSAALDVLGDITQGAQDQIKEFFETTSKEVQRTLKTYGYNTEITEVKKLKEIIQRMTDRIELLDEQIKRVTASLAGFVGGALGGLKGFQDEKDELWKARQIVENHLNVLTAKEELQRKQLGEYVNGNLVIYSRTGE
jgi:hypothetical protein